MPGAAKENENVSPLLRIADPNFPSLLTTVRWEFCWFVHVSVPPAVTSIEGGRNGKLLICAE